MYIFLHVPKTAGTTLRVLFGEVYGADGIFLGYRYKSLDELANAYINLSPAQKSQVSIISGHHEYGLSDLLDGNNRYLTLFRDPIDRVVSTYYFLKGGHGLEQSPFFKGRSSMTLKEFVESGITGEVDNGMVRLLSGNHHTPIGGVSEADLELAKANLRDKFDAFGFSEDFNEALVLFGRKLGRERVPLYRKENATPNRRSLSELSARELAAIEDRCRYDIELHKYARQLYREQIAELGPDFAREVRAYEAAMRDLNRIVDLELEDYKKESSVVWQLSRKPAAMVSRMRKTLGVRTRLAALGKMFTHL